jgi:RNA polymerase sigma factor (sigma-70 family)
MSGSARRVEDDPLLSPEDEAALRAQWRATEALYREEAPHLARYFQRRVPVDEVADLVQESFRRVIKHRPERPGSFLMRTATNLVLELKRFAARRHTQQHVPFDEATVPGRDPHAQLEARDTLRRVERALAKLKPKTRNIFLMARVDGKSYAEIAEIYGMSEEGVKKQVATATWQLRQRVGDL